MEHEQWTLAVASKASTSHNLHRLLPPDLDFFVLLSSLGGILGNAAQANYAAGCTYQDALARHRAARGQRAVSIDVGLMRNVGIVAETHAYERRFRTAAGLWEVDGAELLGLLDVVCDPIRRTPPTSDDAQLLMGLKTPADHRAAGEAAAAAQLAAARPLFTGFLRAGTDTDGAGTDTDGERKLAVTEDWARLFREADGVRARADVVVNAVVVNVAQTRSLARDDVEPGRPLSHYGVDSLMSIEVRNWIGRNFAAKVEVADIMGPDIAITDIGSLVTDKSQLAIQAQGSDQHLS